jgi:hypothetical protein
LGWRPRGVEEIGARGGLILVDSSAWVEFLVAINADVSLLHADSDFDLIASRTALRLADPGA